MLIQSSEYKLPRGQKGTIVTVNGWTCKSRYWGGLRPLNETGIGIFGFDTKGYEQHHFRKLATELADTLREYGIEHPHLVAHSMGGLTAIAFLDLVKEQSYESVRPASVTFVTPVLTDPRETFPKDDRVIRLASTFTGWRVKRIVDSVNENGAPGEINENRSHSRVRTTLTAFQLAAPLLLTYMGADRTVRREFARFLRDAKANDRESTLMELYAICNEGPVLKQKLVAGEVWIPPRVLLIGAKHDLFVSADRATEIMIGTFGERTDLRIELMAKAGHFPFVEFPDQFNRVLASRLQL